MKLPEICALPPNEEKAFWSGWMFGADCTMPSSTIATCLWNCCWARASHWPLPLPVRFMLTTQPDPETNSAFADDTALPVSPALPR